MQKIRWPTAASQLEEVSGYALAKESEDWQASSIVLNIYYIVVVESFFSSLKKERIKKRIYKTRDLAREDVFDYIEVFYNRQRRHSHLGGVSPEAFERASF